MDASQVVIACRRLAGAMDDGWDEQNRRAVAQALLDLSSIFDEAVTRLDDRGMTHPLL